MPSSLAALRRFAEGSVTPAAPPETAGEFCELCNLQLAPEHRHLLETATRKIVCACDACTMTFVPVVEGRYKVIPRDPRALPGFQMSDAEWEALALPIGLAFFFFHTPGEKMVALYPSPAGATESLLPLTAWEALVRQNAGLATLEADVEALLINRVDGRREHWLVPIDKCFELVGTIRIHWRGLSGGEEVWRKIDDFFTALRERAR